jgi:NADH-quinone oxidoreductase subunit C
MTSQQITDALRSAFGDAILEAKLDGVTDPFVTVAPGKLREIGTYLRDDESMLFDTLMCLSGMDYTGGKLGVVYHLASMTHGHKIVLKTAVTREAPRVASVEAVWKTANWHEREAFDLLGIVFDGHPDLRRILTPDDFEGHPLRKEYPVKGY